MISDVILLCALTAELTQSYTHGTCVRGYTHLRQKSTNSIMVHILLVYLLYLECSDTAESCFKRKIVVLLRRVVCGKMFIKDNYSNSQSLEHP